MSTDALYRCYRTIVSGADEGVSLGNPDLHHLANSFAASNYLRFAKNIAGECQEGKVLDWGCGYGQMTLLLRTLGLDVEPFEIDPRPNIESIPPFCDVKITYGEIGEPLPYPDGSFAAAVSCGTLEHVQDQHESLRELHRVLREDGKLLVYMLPNKWSYTERLADMQNRSCHPVKFTPRSARTMFESSGFRVTSCRRANALPHNLTGMPHWLRKGYGELAPLLEPVDRVISAIPVVNLFAGVLELVAVKTPRQGDAPSAGQEK